MIRKSFQAKLTAVTPTGEINSLMLRIKLFLFVIDCIFIHFEKNCFISYSFNVLSQFNF
jgi:hypothetical protein